MTEKLFTKKSIIFPVFFREKSVNQEVNDMKVRDILRITENGTLVTLTFAGTGTFVSDRLNLETQLHVFDKFMEKRVISIILHADDDEAELELVYE